MDWYVTSPAQKESDDAITPPHATFPMMILPILVRELRARGRAATTQWGRMAVAVIGVLACVPLFWTGPLAAPGIAGRGAFHGLVGTAFVLCLSACLLTSDALSSERREGTLPLLLLTRVSHWDILLGKCASLGLGCFAYLLALLPVLTLPLLAGGATAGEAVRNTAALSNTLFMALAGGLCASSVCFDRFRSACMALCLMTALVLIPMLPGLEARLASPLGTVFQAADLAFKASPARFWISLGLVHALSWVLLGGAVVGLRRRSVQFQGTVTHQHGKFSAGGSDAASLPGRNAAPWTVNCRYCGRQNPSEAIHCYECGTELHPKPPPETTWTLSSAPSPLHWLLRRRRGIELMLWVSALLVAFKAAFNVLLFRFLGVGTATIVIQGGFGLFVMAIAGALIAAAASSFVIEARRDGTLEPLLTTPLGADKLVSTQWDIVKRMIRFPLMLMLAPSLLQGVFLAVTQAGGSGYWEIGYLLSLFASMANIVLSVGAICWVALWFAFSGMDQVRTIFWSVLLAHGLPYIFISGWVLLVQSLFFRTIGFPGSSLVPWLAGSLLPQCATFLFYLFLIRLARSRLLECLPGNEPIALNALLQQGLADVSSTIRRVRRWPNG